MRNQIGLPDGTITDVARVGAALQEALVDLTALSLNGKQAHWHVRGPQFVPVHEQLDTIVGDARAWADLVAERAVTLGAPVDGTPGTVATATSVEPFPTGYVEDGKALALVRDAVEAVVVRLRAQVDRLGEVDPVSQDLVIEVLAGLEKHLWMLQAQTA